MRQAIVTKWLGPTNHRGSRVKAKASAGSVVVDWDYAKNVDQNHARAAEALARKYGWDGVWVAGGLPTEDGNVYVYTAQAQYPDTVNEDGFIINRV